MVRSRYGRGSVEVRSRYGRGTVEVWSRCVRYSLGTLVVRYTQGSFPPCILDAPRAWYTYCSFYCSNRAIAASWIRFGHRYYTFNTECREFKGTAHGVKPIQVHRLCIINITVHNN